MSTSPKISLLMAVIIGINAMIGASIFVTPVELIFSTGPAGIISMLLVSIGVWFMAQSFAQLASHYPKEGSFFTYASAWGGKSAGLLATLLYLSGMTVALGLLSKIAGVMYLHRFLPTIDGNLLGTGIIAILALITALGVRVSALGQYVMIACTLFPIISITILCLLVGSWQNLIPFAPHGILSIAQASRLIVFSFFGFECAASLYSIIKEPQKNIGKAFVYSIITVAAIYSLFTLSVMSAFSTGHFACIETRLTEPLRLLYPQLGWFLSLLDIAIVSAIIGTIHAMLWSASYLLAFIIQQITGRTTLPWILQPQHNALVIGLVILLPFWLVHSIGLFFNLTACLVVCAYLLCMVGLLIHRPQRNTIAVIGNLVAFCILLFAIEGIVKTLI